MLAAGARDFTRAIGLGQPVPRLFPRIPYTLEVQRILAPLLELTPQELGVPASSGVFSSLLGQIFGGQQGP